MDLDNAANLGSETASVQGTAEVESRGEYAHGRILDLILSGEFPPGAVLNERDLAGMLSVSRTPVREALSRLEAECLVTRVHGRVPVVSELSIETFITILDMRRVLEVETAGRATGRVPRKDADAVLAAIENLLAIDQPTSAEHWAVDDQVHMLIADCAGNPLIAKSVSDLRRRTRLFNTLRLPTRLLPGGTEHTAMIRAVTGNDPEASRQLMGRHIDNVKGAIINFLLRGRNA